MIEHDFYGFVGTEAVGFSEIRFQAIVQAFRGTEGHLSTCLEPVEDEGLMGAQHACDLLHRLEPRAQSFGAPPIHEF